MGAARLSLQIWNAPLVTVTGQEELRHAELLWPVTVTLLEPLFLIDTLFNHGTIYRRTQYRELVPWLSVISIRLTVCRQLTHHGASSPCNGPTI